MLRLLILVIVAVSISAEETRWVWSRNHRNQRAFNNDQGDKYGNTFYDREKDREPTTSRPTTGQPNDEDFLNPDDLRNYNGPMNFGYPLAAGGVPINNYPPGFGGFPGGQPQGYPTNGYPVPSVQGQPNYPSPAGYPNPTAGGYPQPNTGYPNQGGFQNQGYPNQGYPNQGYPPNPYGPLPGNIGFQGFFAYPGLGNIFGLGNGFPGQGGFPSQGPSPPGQSNAPNLNGNPTGQGAYPYPGFGVAPYPQQGYPNQPGYPTQYPNGNGNPQTGAPYPAGQYVGCGQPGLPLCPVGYPAPYPAQYPGQYQGQFPNGQYPSPDPYAPNNANPYPVTPYNRGGGYAAAFDDYDEMNKNSTTGTNRSLKPEGKTLSSSIGGGKVVKTK